MSVGEAGEVSESGKGRRRVKIRHVFLLLPVLLIVLFAWRNWGLLYSHSEQDQCTFGTDSTALYDRLHAEADTYLAKHGKAGLAEYSPESAQIFADKVLEQLRVFAMTRKTPTKKWVAIHALLRAYGMEFGFNGPRDKEKLKSELVVLSTGYYVQLPTINWLCPLCYVFPTSRFSFQVENRGDGVYDQIKGGLRIRNLNWKWAGVYYRPSDTNCPVVLK